jgi:hypothetical protein
LRTKERAARTKIVTNYVLGMIVFILISFCWIFLLSQKYQHITVGLAGNYNHILVGPNSQGHPMLYMGLLDPPNATAISAWEDISYVKMQDKPWLDSPETLVFEIGNIYKNILKVISIYKEYSLMSLILLPAAVLFLLGRGRRMVFEPIFILLLSSIILISGYLILYVESRYIWLCDIFILIIGATLLDMLLKKIPSKSPSVIVLALLLIASFSLFPFRGFYNNFNAGEDIMRLNNRLIDFGVRGRIASDKEWHNSLYLSFFNNWKYYGERGHLSEPELDKELQIKMIDYFLVWNHGDRGIVFLDKYQDITNGTIDELRIYKLR